MNLADAHIDSIDWKALVELNCQRLREGMREAGVEALITSTVDNWRYITGIPIRQSMAYTTTNLTLLAQEREFPILLPLGDVMGNIRNMAPWFEDIRPLPFEGAREPQQPLGAGVWMQIVVQALKELKLESRKVALDPATPFCWKDELATKLPRLGIVDGGDILRHARVIKNKEEQKAIRMACVIGEIGVQAGLDAVDAGRTEAEIAAIVEHEFRAHGAEGGLSTPFVMAGDYPRVGRLCPTQKVVRHGDLVRIDSGCSYGGYFSDLSRTVFVGSGDKEVSDAYTCVYEALMAGARLAKPGTRNTDLHEVINDTLQRLSGKRYELGWFVGHGLGVGIHEDPMIGRRGRVEEFAMQPGMYFCLEPCVVVPGKGMIGLEDDYLITEDGAEVLTRTEFHL
jgi:Xaa-Pro aminopeptidase